MIAFSILISLFVASAIAFWFYYRRELPVRGRLLLAVLRGTSLALILLLLWNPSVPAGTAADSAPAEMVLVDASLSMTALDNAGVSAWDRSRAALREMETRPGGPATMRLALFGEDFRAIGSGSTRALASMLDGIHPDAAGSRLSPALERVAEAGVRQVTVLSDLRIEDLSRAIDVAERLGVELSFHGAGGEVRNAGIADFTLPVGVEAGERISAEVVLFGESPTVGDSIDLEIREGERLVLQRRLPLPDAGMTRLPLALPPPRGSTTAVYSARVTLERDGFPLDDERVARVLIDPEEGGIVLFSWRPDWEPRFLLPILRQVTGLPGSGYLNRGDDRFLEMGSGLDGGGSITEVELRRRMARADLLVLHGIDRDAPGWLRDAAAASGRLILFPRDPEGAAVAGIRTGAPLRGEWYPSADLPASPLAATLAGGDMGSLPPLARLLPLSQENGADVVPLHMQLQGRGAREAGLVLHAEGRQRRAVALADGFWRWGIRDGAPRQSYRRLWAAVAGWLLGNEPLTAGPGVHPQLSVLPRDRDIAWRAPGMAGEALHVEVSTIDGAPAADTLLQVHEEAGFSTRSLPPGSYRYRVRGAGHEGEAPDGEGGLEVGAGEFEIEPFSGEMALRPADPHRAGSGVADSLVDGREESTTSSARRDRRPLRTHPVPFLLLIGLLCGEWIGRRRKGLR